MEQKDYKLEIVKELLKSKSYVRDLARKINVNHMTISRKIKKLSKENIVDYKKEGKNKVYFLKNNSEAKTYIFITENYKLIQTLKKYPNLRKIIEKIQNNNKIKLAILFGSYSKNKAKKDSDIDIYIETTNKKIKQKLEKIYSKASIKIGKYNKKNLLIKEIEKNHVVIKGVEEYCKKNEFLD